jgi:hypothetical protein
MIDNLLTKHNYRTVHECCKSCTKCFYNSYLEEYQCEVADYAIVYCNGVCDEYEYGKGMLWLRQSKQHV